MIDFENWFTGMVDGEGSFFIAIWKHPRTKTGVALRPEFSITMHKREKPTLDFIKNNLNMGTTNKYKRFASFRVTAFDDCVRLCKFFSKNQLISKKIDDFRLWVECIEKMKRKEHLTKVGIMEIAKIRERMNPKSTKRVKSEEIKKWFKN